MPNGYGACKKSTEKIEEEFLSKCISQINVTENYEWIVILPGAGCHGCIQDGEYFMQQNIKNPNILFVLTKISSQKLLQQKLGFRLNEYPNIYVDRNELFDIPTKNSIYPCVVKLNNGKLANHSFQNPGSNAFRQLKN